jgi:hypothetical protein
MDLLKSSKDAEDVKQSSQRLALYQARQPYRESYTNLLSGVRSPPAR